MRSGNRVAFAAGALLVVFLAAYLPDIGHGFIRDDFGWIRSSRSNDLSQFLGLFSSNVGFYRPLVAMSFASDYALWGLDPFGYGITNLLLCLVDMLLLYALARRLGLQQGAALVTVALWALNVHGINMALLWLSGRTALLVTFFALATAHAVLRRWSLAAFLLCAAAMLCKEEAVVLPALMTAFLAIDGLRRRQQGLIPDLVVRTWPLWAVIPLYAALRLQSGAFGPVDAPWYYQFSSSPLVILRNIAEYADRAATVPAIIAVALLFVCGWKGSPFSDDERRTILLGVLWVPAMYALTVFLPIRSSLYAVLPSIGACLAAGAVAARAARMNPVRFQRTAVVLTVVVALMIPVYWIRNERWSELARFSGELVRSLQLAVLRDNSAKRVAFVDDPAADPNFESAFGSAVDDAVVLALDADATGTLLAAGVAPPADATHIFQLRNGRLARFERKAGD